MPPAIHPSAAVETDSIGSGVSIGEFTVVRDGARIGDGATIHPNVVIEAGVEIGAGTEVLPGTYIGRRPKAVGAVVRKLTHGERVRIGAGCSIGACAVIYVDVEIGDDTLIGDHAALRETARISSGCAIGRGTVMDRDIEVGPGTAIGFGSTLVSGSRVGREVFIAQNVITTNDNALGRPGGVEERLVGATIEDRARIGANATLLPGVVIGSEAIVGAGSIVTRDVEAGITVVGNPARPISRR